MLPQHPIARPRRTRESSWSGVHAAHLEQAGLVTARHLDLISTTRLTAGVTPMNCRREPGGLVAGALHREGSPPAAPEAAPRSAQLSAACR